MTHPPKNIILEPMPKLRLPETSKIIRVALALIVFAVIIAALLTIVRAVFFKSDTGYNSAELDYGRSALLSSSAGRSVKMTVRGNIVGDESFRSLQIEVSPNTRTLTKTIGYMGPASIISTKPNNIPAYEQFINALDKANIMKGKQFTDDKNEILGICATGYLYNFELFSYNTVEKNLWTSTCPGSKGSLRANLQQVYDLFAAQIPESEELIKDIWQ